LFEKGVEGRRHCKHCNRLRVSVGKNGAFGTNFYAGTVRVKDFELLRLQKGVKKGTDERGETEKNM
jgi:hypothetical protein